jgi:quercetin dioxygenase-like cupin family protein
MEILRFGLDRTEPIGPRPYAVRDAFSIELAEGAGEAHAYAVYFHPGGMIGPHEAGFGQLFFAVSGSGWVAGGDGVPVPLAEGEGAFIRRGEIHSKGSERGMTAVMIQVRQLELIDGGELS